MKRLQFAHVHALQTANSVCQNTPKCHNVMRKFHAALEILKIFVKGWNEWTSTPIPFPSPRTKGYEKSWSPFKQLLNIGASQNFMYAKFSVFKIYESLRVRNLKILQRADFQNSLFAKLSAVIIYKLFPQRFRFEDIWKPSFLIFFLCRASEFNISININLRKLFSCCVQFLSTETFVK